MSKKKGQTYLSTGGILHDKKQEDFAVDDLVKADHVGMIEKFHDADFTRDHAKRLFIESILLDDLDGDLGRRESEARRNEGDMLVSWVWQVGVEREKTSVGDGRITIVIRSEGVWARRRAKRRRRKTGPGFSEYQGAYSLSSQVMDGELDISELTFTNSLQ